MLAKIRKAVAPSVAALIAVGVDWISTGKLNTDSAKIAVAGLVTSLLVFIVPNEGDPNA